ncbi:MAG TPA: helix-turn-helix transcriptional regulator [Solirubrobacteraceae bacterium]|nr:helix-turn-helix transcriptional regulator [Solirubrobacteraceae bacterium]
MYTSGSMSDKPSEIELLSELLSLLAIAKIDPRSTLPQVDTHMRIGSAIANGFDDPDFTIGDVTLAVGLSERRVRDVLAEDNTSFRGEVMKLRMAKARLLIVNSRYTIDEIAFLCGYRCASTFAARFREINDMAPRAWRESYEGESRAGGTTGCFRNAAERARAARNGYAGPDTRRPRPTPGERAMLDHDIKHAERRARLRGELAESASIAQRAKVLTEGKR